MNQVKDNTIAPFDEQGDFKPEERVERAMNAFLKDFGRTTSLYLESCVHCGLCAEACQFYVQTGDPKYTPIFKLEPFKRAYKREVGPFSWLAKLVTKKVTVQDLQNWQELIYDSCTMCARCSMICPMGIDIAELIGQARHGMYEAGLVPARLAHITRNQSLKDGSQSATPDEWVERVAYINETHEVNIPIDADSAEVLITVSAGMIEEHTEDIAAIAKILDHAGFTYTTSATGFEATNFGMLSGNQELQKRYTMHLIESAVACGAKYILLPECGHAYGALKWKGPDWYGKPLPFEVIHMSEFLGRMVDNGRIKVKKIEGHGPISYHDPCQTARRGGVFDEPRKVLKALGLELKEFEHSQEYNWCCGGGGGALANYRNVDLRKKVFEIKIKQAEQSKCEGIVSACHQCGITFARGKKEHHWDMPFESLQELVAHNLDEKKEDK